VVSRQFEPHEPRFLCATGRPLVWPDVYAAVDPSPSLCCRRCSVRAPRAVPAITRVRRERYRISRKRESRPSTPSSPTSPAATLL